MSLEVVVDHSPLEREIWTFNFASRGAGVRFFLNGYSRQTRETTRHRFIIQYPHYDMFHKRMSGMNLEDVPAPPEDAVRQLAMDNIEFTRHPQEKTPLFPKKD